MKQTSFPVTLKLAGLPVVVVGGGQVGRRKALAAREAGAIVRIIALEPRPVDIAEEIEWVVEPYRTHHLNGQTLVFAAATMAVNASVVADATARQLWVCDSADPARGNVSLPAVGRVGAVSVSVDTGGAAPALARRLRDKILEEIDPAIADWTELLGEMRVLVLEQVADADVRRALFRDFAAWHWLEKVKREGVAATRVAMLAAVEKACRG